jgi:hypothetical protein
MSPTQVIGPHDIILDSKSFDRRAEHRSMVCKEEKIFTTLSFSIIGALSEPSNGSIYA